MSELPVPAAPADHSRDRLDRYRCRLGIKQTLVDRRVFWASQDRELAGFNGLRKSEVRARRRFWRLTQRGVDAVQAIQLALGLDDGPIPELHTVEQFAELWTESVLKAVAERWLDSALTQRCAAPPVTTAISMLEDAAPEMAAVLITTARNPKVRDTDRWKSARDALILTGAKVNTAPGAPASSTFRLTGKETVPQLEELLLQVPQLEKDTNRARLFTENILRHLEAKAPETWGKKLKLQHEGNVGLAGILVEMEKRRDAALADVRREAVDAEVLPQIAEADPK